MPLPPTAYAQQLLRQGYSPQVIRNQLLRAGYSPYDAEQALRVANRVAGVSPAMRQWMLIGIGIGILALIIILILLLLPSSASLSLELSVQATPASPGGSAQASISLESDGPLKVTITYALLSSGGVLVWSAKEEASVDGSTVLRKSIEIPATAQPGRYSVRVTAAQGGTPVSKAAALVVERAGAPSPGSRRNETVLVPEQTPEKPTVESCPSKCDDFYACTTDACAGGRCVYTPILPCCGNLACESGESSVGCAQDCRPQAPSDSTDTKSRAVTAASRSPEEALQLCRTIPLQDRQDDCFDVVAQAAARSELCNAIQDSLRRDNCLMEFALHNDFSVCDRIEDRYLASSCFVLSREGAE